MARGNVIKRYVLNRCIRVIKLWRLKPGFRCILSSNAQKCVERAFLQTMYLGCV